MYDVGSIPLALHMFLSSCTHLWEAGLEGSRWLRAYVDLSGKWRRIAGGSPCPSSQQARKNHCLQGSARIVRIPPHEVCR